MKRQNIIAFTMSAAIGRQKKNFSALTYKKDVDKVLAKLIEEGFIKEERFTERFASGHFRIKQRGETKINYGLRQKGISAYYIKIVLACIEKADYLKQHGSFSREK